MRSPLASVRVAATASAGISGSAWRAAMFG